MLPYFVGKCLNAYGKAWYCEDAIRDNVKMLRPKKGKEPTLEWLDHCVRHMKIDWLIIDPFNPLDRAIRPCRGFAHQRLMAPALKSKTRWRWRKRLKSAASI